MRPASRQDKDRKDEGLKSRVFIFPDLSRYDGEYREQDGVITRHGTGIYTDKATGCVYMGQWETDKHQGKGKMTFANGANYDGQWKEGTFHGIGIYSWPDGSSVSGEFVNNCPVGPVKYLDAQSHGWIGNSNRGTKCTLSPELY